MGASCAYGSPAPRTRIAANGRLDAKKNGFRRHTQPWAIPPNPSVDRSILNGLAKAIDISEVPTRHVVGLTMSYVYRQGHNGWYST